jgi:Uma2 family endonuclease
MSAQPDLAQSFRALEAVVEALPEGVNAEIARGVYAMSPRPRVRHSAAQGRLFSLLHRRLGGPEGSTPPDWLFLVEPEMRSEAAFSRLIPDVAGWKRSAAGWPDPEINPIELAPEWVAEVISEGTERFDRGPKKDAYGLIGVGWLWLVDAEKKTLETFENVRGKMIEGSRLAAGSSLVSAPFGDLSARLDELFLD